MPIRYGTVGAVVLAFILAAVVARVAQLVIRRLLAALDIVGAENREAVHARARQLMRALTMLAYGVAALASISLALERFGINEPQWSPRLLVHWALTHGVNLIIIGFGAFIVIRAANLAIDHFQFRLARRHTTADLEWQRRSATLSGILTSMVTATVGFVAILMLLRELSIDIVPILTGAGIAGLAIGFGAQNLVRDVISGFFLILEDQVRIGDLARINSITGIVEQINLRTIQLRDGEGAVHVFPNGTVSALANLSKQFAYAVVDVRIAYQENMDRVIGFGAQNLVRDVISGFFLILEDQVRIGDLARINSITGIVEQINLRTIQLRDGEGAVHVFPNGTISALANLSKQFAYAVVDVRIAYQENMDRVIGTMREVGASMERDALWGALLLAPLDVIGVESLNDGMATVRVKFKTQPLTQGKVASELRRRLMIAFVGRRIKPFV